MRKMVLVLIGMVFSLNVLGQSSNNHYVTSSKLNLRANPNTESDIKIKLNQYDNVILLKDSVANGWVKIKFGNNEGFVSKLYLKKGKAVVTTYEVRVGAICRDGTRSNATGRGACSHHGGVSRWLTETKKSVRIEAETNKEENPEE